VRHDVYARSDQMAFAEAGIPALLVSESFETLHRDPRAALAWARAWEDDRYHTPADDLEQAIDWAAAEQHAALLLELTLALADSEAAPRWHPGSPYRAAQLRARAEGR
jgi:Zn-dependent M28 family amino/carboxypeptidase